MGNTVKSIVIILGFCTLAWGGYYFYVLQSGSSLEGTSDEQLQTMLANTSIFIERRQALDQIDLNLSFFEDPRFRSFASHTKTLESKSTGRANPFAPVEGQEYFTNTEVEQ